MINDTPTIEFIEKLGELAKNFGALLVKYAQNLEAERQREIDLPKVEQQREKALARLAGKD